MTPEVVPLKVIMVNVPPVPTEDFLGGTASLDDRTIFRWVTVFRYPEGVGVEEGDDWYINVHASEVMRQPGLTRFFSYRVLPRPCRCEGIFDVLAPASRSFPTGIGVSSCGTRSGNGASIVPSPPVYTPPPWLL